MRGKVVTDITKTVVVVDNVDIDNLLAAVAACHPALEMTVKAVIVTGRPAHPDPTAPIDALDVKYSEEIRRRNARRMKGTLMRHGYGNIPVYEGLIAPRTLVPHHVHIDERLLDPYFDEGYVETDGSFADAMEFLASLEGTIDFVVGGPLTEIAALMYDRRLDGKFGMLTCQLGMFGFNNAVQLMAGGRKQFNAACDPNAVAKVLADYPGTVWMVPTDVTKDAEVGWSHPHHLREVGISEELIGQYVTFWSRALKPRGEGVYPHDVHPVFAMVQARGTILSMYTSTVVKVANVGQDGEIDVVFGAEGSHTRLVAQAVNPDRFKAMLREYGHGIS
jgi:inosine-uridine nucleoside N-ribohydrolase